MPKYQAAEYIRLSYTDDKMSESDSVGNQRKLIENFVSQNADIEVIEEKIDDGYSGIIFDRPAFKEMMQDVTDGKINCVIVKDLSRLGREYIETGRYLRRIFPAYGVRFIAINDNIDTARENCGDDLAVSVKNIMNEAYCRDISIKTRSSLDVKRRNGDFVGAFPIYGYLKSSESKNKLEPDPYASRVVRDIFRMRLEGSSASRIAAELNRLCVFRLWHTRRTTACLTPSAATQTRKTANGLRRPLSAFCRMKHTPALWCRASKERRIKKSRRWSSTLPRTGFAFRARMKRSSRSTILNWYSVSGIWIPVPLPHRTRYIFSPAFLSAAAAARA